jgi:hypothetical protein
MIDFFNLNISQHLIPDFLLIGSMLGCGIYLYPHTSHLIRACSKVIVPSLYFFGQILDRV